MNLSNATRACKDLQREMREVRNKRFVDNNGFPHGGLTQLHYYCEHGMTSSVVRMLEMRSIDVEGRSGGREDGDTCLHIAALKDHLDICRLLIDNGAQLEAKESDGWTPLHYAANYGLVEVVRLLCDCGADVEARTTGGWHLGLRPLHCAVLNDHISVVKELIEERNAEINARDDDERTALRVARGGNNLDVAAYLVSHGGIV